MNHRKHTDVRLMVFFRIHPVFGGQPKVLVDFRIFLLPKNLEIRRVGLTWLNPSAFGPNQLFRWKNITTISATVEGVSAPLPAASDS